MRTRTHGWKLGSIGLALLAATSLAAQEQKPDKKPASGAAAPAAGTATQEAGPIFVAVKAGAKPDVVDATGQKLGKVQDHVIDAKSGLIRQVVLMPEGVTDAVLVPFTRFAWDPKKQDFTLALTMDELASLQKFDAEKFHKDSATAAEAKAQPMSTEVLGSALFKSKLMAQAEPWGSISDALIDPRRGVISLVAVDAGGADVFVVPWQSLTRKGANEFALSMAKADLATAPTVKRTDLRALSDKAAIEKIYAFYKVQPPMPGNPTTTPGS